MLNILRHLSPARISMSLATCMSLWLFAALAPPSLAAEPRFDLLDRDRAVLLGDTFIERERFDGYLETMLTRHYPGRRITFRNLGWSGDTVSLQPRPLNFGDLSAHLARLKPTLVFVNYGMNESFDGPKALPQFTQGYGTILDMLANLGARIVLVSPTPHENLGPRLPDPAEHNRQLRLYLDSIRRIAHARNLPFVDLFDALGARTQASPSAYPLTDNGIHLTAYGYWRAAAALENGLALPPSHWQVTVNVATSAASTDGTKADQLHASPSSVRFRATDALLPPPPPPHGSPPDSLAPKPSRVLRVSGLPAGRYSLRIDGKPILTALSAEWAAGITLSAGPDFDQVERLRQTIVHKNALFFYRWRAHNGEYIYGRRAKASGGNAGNDQFPAEMQQLEDLIAHDETRIAHLAVPVSHTYELAVAE